MWTVAVSVCFCLSLYLWKHMFTGINNYNNIICIGALLAVNLIMPFWSEAAPMLSTTVTTSGQSNLTKAALAGVYKNICHCHMYVIWFQLKLKCFRFRTLVKNQSFSEDACLNALHKFGLKLDCLELLWSKKFDFKPSLKLNLSMTQTQFRTIV